MGFKKVQTGTVIKSYTGLTKALKGEGLRSDQIRFMSKRQRLDYAKSKGWIYDPQHNFGASSSSELKDIDVKVQRELEEERQQPQKQEPVFTGLPVSESAVTNLKGGYEDARIQQSYEARFKPSADITYSRQEYIKAQQQKNQLREGEFFTGQGQSNILVTPTGYKGYQDARLQQSYTEQYKSSKEIEFRQRQATPERVTLKSNYQKFTEKVAKTNYWTAERTTKRIMPSEKYSLGMLKYGEQELKRIPQIWNENKTITNNKSIYDGQLTGYSMGVYKTIRNKPLTTMSYVGLGYVASGVSAGIAATGKAATSMGYGLTGITFTAAPKVLGIGAGVLYTGAKGYEYYKAPTPYKKGGVLGKAATELIALGVGSKLYGKTAKAFTKTDVIVPVKQTSTYKMTVGKKNTKILKITKQLSTPVQVYRGVKIQQRGWFGYGKAKTINTKAGFVVTPKKTTFVIPRANQNPVYSQFSTKTLPLNIKPEPTATKTLLDIKRDIGKPKIYLTDNKGKLILQGDKAASKLAFTQKFQGKKTNH